MLKSKKLRLTLAALCATVMVVGLAACAPRANNPAARAQDHVQGLRVRQGL